MSEEDKTECMTIEQFEEREKEKRLSKKYKVLIELACQSHDIESVDEKIAEWIGKLQGISPNPVLLKVATIEGIWITMSKKSHKCQAALETLVPEICADLMLLTFGHDIDDLRFYPN